MLTAEELEKLIEGTLGELGAKFKSLTSLIIERTKEYNDQFSSVKKIDDELRVILDCFGCNKKYVLNLLKYLNQVPKDQTLPEDATYLRSKPGMVVVPVKHSDSHDYPLEEPSIITDSTHAYRIKSGSRGNCLPSSTTCFRPCTDEELHSVLSDGKALLFLLRYMG